MPPLSSLPASATNPLSIAELRSAAARDPKAAIRETAKQFEALFMQQLMKSMREATISSGMLDNEGTKLGTEMLDSQYAAKMTGLPGGLPTRSRASSSGRWAAAPRPRWPPRRPPRAGAAGRRRRRRSPLSAKQVDFVQQHAGAARAAEAQTGIPAAFMVGQAAHESGWGRQRDQECRRQQRAQPVRHQGRRRLERPGRRDHDHRIRRRRAAEGDREVPRLRVVRRIVPRLRPADEGEPALRRASSPRPRRAPASAASAAGFAQGLQRAGYATDPAYADKLARVINTTMRVQRATA